MSRPTTLRFDPAPVNIVGVLGDKIEFTMTFQENGVAVDYSTFTITASARPSEGGDVQAFTIDMTDAVNGVIGILIPAAVTAVLREKNQWDMQADDGSGPVTIAAGELNLNLQVTSP